MLFTEVDVKAFVRAAVAHARDIPPLHELISGGLILESHARDKINRIIFSDTDSGRITLLQLVSETSLELKKVEALLPPAEDGEWGRVGTSFIVGRKEFLTLKEDVRQKLADGTVIGVPRYCQERSIDLGLFRKILRLSTPTLEVHWMGQDRKLVCSRTLYDQCKTELRDLLEKSTSPIEVSSMLAERDLPYAFVTLLLSLILREYDTPVGVVKDSVYTPRVYTEKRQTALVSRLKSEGAIDIASFKKECIHNIQDFILRRSSDSHILESYIVTEEFLSQAVNSARESLERGGWAEINSSDTGMNSGDVKQLRALVKKRLVGAEEHGSYLISQSFQESLSENAVSYAIRQAELTPISQLKESGLPTQLKYKELLSYLAVECSLPVPVLTSFMSRIHTVATSKYLEHVIHLRNAVTKAAQDVFIDKCYARFRVHHMAVQEISEAGLRAKLAADLVEFSRELVASQLSKLETSIRVNDITSIPLEPLFDLRTMIQSLAVGTPKAKPEVALAAINENIATFMRAAFEFEETKELIDQKKGEILGDLNSQLLKAKEPSLALTLVLVILHAKLSDGVLRASGKYVPRLLKLLQGRIEPQAFDLLVKKKDAVITRSPFVEEDFVELGRVVESLGV